MNEEIQTTWKNLHTVGEEQMTRLRVSAVFHRSVDEQMEKVKDLKNDLSSLYATDDQAIRKTQLRKLHATRDRLLTEIGRMIRLGRLLKTRLKEPFILES